MIGILAGTLLLLGGCALSPQEVTLKPDPSVPAANLGKNAPVRVTVVDDREDEAFGTRGGVYKDTALIRPANDITAEIREIVRNGLQKQGFNAYNPPAEATNLSIHIDTLSYVPESGAVVNQVTTRAVLKAVARRPDVTHRGTFRSKVTHDVPFTPDARRNETMLTDVLARSLERMLADAKLLAFLAGSDNPDAAVPAANEQPAPEDAESTSDSEGQPPPGGQAGGS
jgi:uncharacterized lipoprotein